MVLAIGALTGGSLRGLLVLGGFVILTVLFLRTWFILTARTRAALVAKADMADAARLAILSAVFVAIPIIALVLGAALLLVLQEFDAAAR